jgi:hypothetical protein
MLKSLSPHKEGDSAQRRQKIRIKNATGLSDSKSRQRPSDASGATELEKVVPHRTDFGRRP